MKKSTEDEQDVDNDANLEILQTLKKGEKLEINQCSVKVLKNCKAEKE